MDLSHIGFDGLVWWPCANQATEDCPPASLVFVNAADDTGLLHALKPTTDNQRVAITGPSLIDKNGGTGFCTFEGPAYVTYEAADGTPAYGETWGAKTNDWKLRKGYPGFRVIGGIIDGKVLVERIGVSEIEFVAANSTTAVVGSSGNPVYPADKWFYNGSLGWVISSACYLNAANGEPPKLGFRYPSSQIAGWTDGKPVYAASPGYPFEIIRISSNVANAAGYIPCKEQILSAAGFADGADAWFKNTNVIPTLGYSTALRYPAVRAFMHTDGKPVYTGSPMLYITNNAGALSFTSGGVVSFGAVESSGIRWDGGSFQILGATTTQQGAVTTGAQSWEGAKTFVRTVNLSAGVISSSAAFAFSAEGSIAVHSAFHTSDTYDKQALISATGTSEAGNPIFPVVMYKAGRVGIGAYYNGTPHLGPMNLLEIGEDADGPYCDLMLGVYRAGGTKGKTETVNSLNFKGGLYTGGTGGADTGTYGD